MKRISVIFENDEILLVNKESGVSVQGGSGIAHPLDEELSLQVGYKIHLVHRLDKETAGILIVAKNPAAASKWTKLIQTDQVRKEYWALCFGVPVVNGKKQLKGKINQPIEAHGKKQSAVTYFEVEKTFMLEIPASENHEKQLVEVSRLHVTLGTGRMHQIRIHMSKSGSPLCGDDRHGDFKLNKAVRRAGIKHLCLASCRLTIPLDGAERTFEIPLPDSFDIDHN